jgi:hypothetical protein
MNTDRRIRRSFRTYFMSPGHQWPPNFKVSNVDKYKPK